MDNKFNDIRAFEQEDFLLVRQQLVSNEEFCGVLSMLSKQMFAGNKHVSLLDVFRGCESVEDVDWRIIIPLLEYVVKLTATSINIKGSENITSAGQLFLSNHRDIILDASLLTMLIRKHNNQRIYMGMGTNLYVTSWIEPLVRLAKCFSVKRGGTPRELLSNSTLLSEYIAAIIRDKHSGAWLAQREGRAKDSNDLTQPALIKMLLLAADKQLSLDEQIAQLHITPVAISYEYDPCDYLKARELQLRRDYKDFRKTPQDDYDSMLQGIKGYKGRINYQICKTIDDEARQICSTPDTRNEQINKICHAIDQKIHSGYVIYEVNKIAYDLLLSTNRFANEYNSEQKQRFEDYLAQRLKLINIENKDNDFLRHKLLEMYANPLINQIAAVS